MLNCRCCGDGVKYAAWACIAIAFFVVSVAFSDGAEAAKKRAKPHAGDQVAEAPPPPAVHDWSGFYIGMNAGVAWGQFDPVTLLGPFRCSMPRDGRAPERPVSRAARKRATIGNPAPGSPASRAMSAICI